MLADPEAARDPATEIMVVSLSATTQRSGVPLPSRVASMSAPLPTRAVVVSSRMVTVAEPEIATLSDAPPAAVIVMISSLESAPIRRPWVPCALTSA